MRNCRKKSLLRLLLMSFLVVALVSGMGLGVLAAEEQQGASDFKDIWVHVWNYLNFFILAFFLVKLLREPLSRFFQERSHLIREQIQGAEQGCLEAERQMEETERRFETLDEEIERLKQIIGEQGKRERERIIERARTSADLILERARTDAALMVRGARDRLRAEVVELAVETARERIQKAISATDQKRLLDEYLQDLARRAESRH